MKKCEVLDIIKNFNPDKRISFTIEDILEVTNCTREEVLSLLETYSKLNIIKKVDDDHYMVKNMCMLSQF